MFVDGRLVGAVSCLYVEGSHLTTDTHERTAMFCFLIFGGVRGICFMVANTSDGVQVIILLSSRKMGWEPGGLKNEYVGVFDIWVPVHVFEQN
jgi:hypothetical protein